MSSIDRIQSLGTKTSEEPASAGLKTLKDSPALKRLQGSGALPEESTLEAPKLLHCPPGQDGSPPFGSPGFLY
ncbi:MAG: hypothetical protein AMXMBFR33_09920 [Candidatus Xenobia bacterium]|jgi:hypothetical protein